MFQYLKKILFIYLTSRTNFFLIYGFALVFKRAKTKLIIYIIIYTYLFIKFRFFFPISY